ncbi:MAG: 6-bladed beta-propeller [Rikenellaceae bacterium]
MKKIVLFSFIAIMFGCQSVDTNSGDLISIDLAKLMNVGKKDYTFDFKDVSLITLEDNDNSLLGNISIAGASEDVLVLSSNNKVYLFDARSGEHIRTIDKVGKAGNEYVMNWCTTADFDSQSISIFDWSSKKVVKYSFEGEFINKVDNDSIIWTAANGGYNYAFNSPKLPTKYDFGIYDSDWSLVKGSKLRKYTNENSNRLFVVGMYNIDNTIYVSIDDTTSLFNEKFELQPLFVMNKGSYKCPKDVETDLAQKDQLKNYVTSDYLMIMGDYIFYDYMYNDKKYQDVWSLKDRDLLYRNILEGSVDRVLNFKASEGQLSGFPINYKGTLIYTDKPKYVKDNRAYFEIEPTYINDLGVLDREVENPVIMCVEFM